MFTPRWNALYVYQQTYVIYFCSNRKMNVKNNLTSWKMSTFSLLSYFVSHFRVNMETISNNAFMLFCCSRNICHEMLQRWSSHRAISPHQIYFLFLKTAFWPRLDYLINVMLPSMPHWYNKWLSSGKTTWSLRNRGTYKTGTVILCRSIRQLNKEERQYYKCVIPYFL